MRSGEKIKVLSQFRFSCDDRNKGFVSFSATNEKVRYLLRDLSNL